MVSVSPDVDREGRAERDIDDRRPRQAEHPVESGGGAHVALLRARQLAVDSQQPAAEGGGASPVFCATSERILSRESPAHTAIAARPSPPNGEKTPIWAPEAAPWERDRASRWSRWATLLGDAFPFQLDTLDRDDRGARVLGDAHVHSPEGARVTDCRIASLSERLVDAKHDAAGPAQEHHNGASVLHCQGKRAVHRSAIRAVAARPRRKQLGAALLEGRHAWRGITELA